MGTHKRQTYIFKGLKADIASKDEEISELKVKLGVYEHVVQNHKEEMNQLTKRLDDCEDELCKSREDGSKM